MHTAAIQHFAGGFFAVDLGTKRFVRKKQPPIEQTPWLPPPPESEAQRLERLEREEQDRQALAEIHARQWAQDMADIAREQRKKAKPRRHPAKKAAPERSINKGSYQRRATEPGVHDGRDRAMHERWTARLVADACDEFFVRKGMPLAPHAWRQSEGTATGTGDNATRESCKGLHGHAEGQGEAVRGCPTPPAKESLTRT
jgi:hypothetical protein